MRTFLIIFAAGFALGQTVQREGQYWVRSGGSQPAQLAPQVRRLEIFSRANVTVRGSEDGQIQIQLRQKVRANTAEEADRMWGPVAQIAPFIAVGGTLRFEVYPPGSTRVVTEVEIRVPRQMPFVWVNNRSGSVEMYDLDGSVQADSGGGPLVMDRIRGDVRGYTGFGEIRLGTIGGSALCSSGGGSISLESAAGGMNCVTGGGDIAVKYAGGAVAVSTEGGNVRVEKGGSTVRARSVAGVVEVVQARGAVFADTGGGSIQIGSANGVRAESAAGTIRVKGGTGPMTVSTMLGNIVAEFMAGGRLADSSLMSGSGDITVMIPTGLGVAVRARNESGVSPRIISDFPELQIRTVGLRAPQGQGSINGGGPVLELNTNGGTIYVRRTK